MRVMSFPFLMPSGRQPGLESPSNQGRGTSEASGAWPWRRSGSVRGGGLWSAVEGRRKAPWNSGRDRRCGWADSLRGLGRNGPSGGREARWLERGTAVIRALAVTLNQGKTATTLMRAEPRSLWQAAQELGGGECRRADLR